MSDNKTDFYLNKIYDSLSENLKIKLSSVINNAFYVRIFDRENTLLVQKKEYINGVHSNQLYAYSLSNGNFKFIVEIPSGYFLVYPFAVGEEKVMGMICKPIDINDHYAIEFSINKDNGELCEIRHRLCMEDINLANSSDNTSENSVYPVTEIMTDKQKNSVVWKYNSKKVCIYSNEDIVYAIYHDFEEIILLLTSNTDGERSVYLYNLDGSFHKKLELPLGFEIAYCPTKIVEYNRTLVLVICYNSDISVYDELKYILVPDNGDLIYIGRQR